MTDKRQTGNTGEDLVVRFLKKQGCRILARNIRLSHNELDIVACDKHYLRFIEVKTRSMSPNDATFDRRPAASITKEKQRRIITAARAYLSEYTHPSLPIRFDVAEVYLPSDGEPVIQYMEGAFTA